ncbi:TIGR04282 family arsenosugar biosynthesis glycosyltransferase [Limosilactobacillus antri]|uniref:Glycosyltransferase n=1 Tax=Limosilactobacillus antri DSM 16041 TaxID=525309 RepID=C8P4C5_9LACO|nr:TIGR04282 family arsenosugar biosynthesis glycosyltransferase [Limosilactobacillus antri]EEW54693.1 hypothetical protein HMPREF0494_0169 [Limosilactobacillus antri DSM 16041]KRK60713.1 hypothetical protein FC31_GL000746 [Limosilactobacillus antri DSM 16041]
MKNNKAYIIFTRIPTPGKCKTRLIPTYSGQEASDLQGDLLTDLLVSVVDLPAAGIDVFVAYSDEQGPTRFLNSLPAGVQAFAQHGANIGERMNNAMATVFAAGYQEVVLTGSDLPELTAQTIRRAFAVMKEIVIGPSADGGYYLIGAQRGVDLVPLFTNPIDWGQSTVLQSTLRAITRHDVQLLDAQVDVDTPADLERVKQHLDRHNQQLQQWLTEEK